MRNFLNRISHWFNRHGQRQDIELCQDDAINALPPLRVILTLEQMPYSKVFLLNLMPLRDLRSAAGGTFSKDSSVMHKQKIDTPCARLIPHVHIVISLWFVSGQMQYAVEERESNLHGLPADGVAQSIPEISSLSMSDGGPKAERHVGWDAEPVRPPSVKSVLRYPGAGTRDDPYIVDWDLGDPENPYNWSTKRKWLITSQVSRARIVLVSFSSSAYSGGMSFLRQDIPMSEEVVVLGISLYVLGFALGPLLFAPLSEMFGRRRIFLCTYSAYTLFHIGGALGHNTATILTTRLLAGIFGSSPLTNAGGAIADIFNARDRGIASAIYSTAPYLGPVVGPIVGGFVSENPSLGWRFTFWLMFIFSAVNLILGAIVTPETYEPVLLRRRAQKLQKQSNGSLYYTTAYQLNDLSFRARMRINLIRPFPCADLLGFLFMEPIVTLIALYISITYATLYAEFSAFPIVFQEHRGFTAGQGGLAFLGIGAGVVIGTALAPIQNRLYWRAMDRSESGHASPEAHSRLYLAMVGGVLLPIGLFWFAWTTFPSIHWIVPILGGIPLGTAIALILQSLTAYMMDTYTIYCASAIAATVLLRSVLAAAFPLFSPVMFRALGDQWASSVFAFLALACMPVPILFWEFLNRDAPHVAQYLPTSALPSPPVPNVYVHPPEEEQVGNPPWCYFDASEPHEELLPLSSSHDFFSGSQTLTSISEVMVRPTADDAAAFHRAMTEFDDAVMPRRSTFYHQRPESPLGIRADEIRERVKVKESVGEDEDVIEVVKLRKSAMREEMAEKPALTLKKSKTFKARATSAFRSLKIVGRGSRKVSAQEVFSSSDNSARSSQETSPGTQETPLWLTTPTPKLKRRVSRSLSQMFGLSQSDTPAGDISDSYEEVTSESPPNGGPPVLSLPSSIRRASSLTMSRPPTSAVHVSSSHEEFWPCSELVIIA
ncbi:hypothetical protein EW146_g5400 [Bondarzewia mesenterica]|uniref:Major facilitator superfamily (MFS) profile domain-containing protein n=1 Tax=Bondarzewia mesenterica TaxID=1095465 RepID=A0A4S4LTQ3_9AGAM|nr:hypothetical protein EW146_g5400 [Bondarzewia mesenterica]